MILGFKPQFNNKIKKNIKVHTIREDIGNRWKPGNSIQFFNGVRTKEMTKFTYDRECVSVQKIKIDWSYFEYLNAPAIFIDDRQITEIEKILLATNDGFDLLFDFYEWFNKDFEGKIIHWTKLKY